MPVLYNNKVIIPNPSNVSVSKSKNETGDGRQISCQYDIVLTGSLLPFKGGIFNNRSEDYTSIYDSDNALTKILQKQTELRNLFKEEGKILQIQGWDSSVSDKYLVKGINIDFGDGQWYNKADYTINCNSVQFLPSGTTSETRTEYGDFSNWYLQDASDNYTMENNGDGSAEITRSIDAKGLAVYDPNNPGQLLNGLLPYQQASGWCLEQDSPNIETFYSGVIESILPGFKVIDTKNAHNIDKYDGNYTIERSWLVSNTGVYIISKNSDETEESERDEGSLGLNFEIQGLGFTNTKKYTHAKQYWEEKGITTRQQKIDHIRSDFSDVGADTGSWYYRSFGEAINKEAGSIGNRVDLTGHSGVYHSYEINAETNWKDLPEKTLSLNGTIIGTGDETASKKESALSYYDTIDFIELASGVSSVEFPATDSLYLQTQSLSLNNETGQVGYSRNYVSNSGTYTDKWNIDYSQSETGEENSITLNGQLNGLVSDKQQRWYNVYTAFSNNFTSDSAVWDSKVTTVLGASTPAYKNIKSRSFGYNNVDGTIDYSYVWGTSAASSGDVTYNIDAAYDRAQDFWTITMNGTVRGTGNLVSEKLANGFILMPSEYEAWTHAYDTVVRRLDDNANAGDKPLMSGDISNSRYLTSRNVGADENTGDISFTYVWSTSDAMTSGFLDVSTSSYSWDEATATETVTVNGKISAYDTESATAAQNLTTGWNYVFNGGNPNCPDSIYAARHTGYYEDTTNTFDKMPTYFPISSDNFPSSPPNAITRGATLSSSTMEKNVRTNEITYTFVFNYKAWRYNLPLWLTNVSINFDYNPSIDVWVEKPIIGRRSGPIQQDLTARTSTSFNFSTTLSSSKRKADQFGKYLMLLLEEYSEYVKRQVFADESGYGQMIDGYGSTNRNCRIGSESITKDIINGSLTRTATIVALDILE